jgi:hypothetical protein
MKVYAFLLTCAALVMADASAVHSDELAVTEIEMRVNNTLAELVAKGGLYKVTCYHPSTVLAEDFFSLATDGPWVFSCHKSGDALWTVEVRELSSETGPGAN